MCDNNKSVIIIGGGLVGALCACFLAKRGYHIEVYEVREDLRKCKLQRGRSINLALSHRGRRALRTVGLEEEVLKHAIPMKGRLLHNLPHELSSVPYDEQTNQCIYSVSRNLLNEVLLTAAEEYDNVTLTFSCKLVDANLKEGSCVIQNLKTNETIKAKADLIIGADGAYSKLRSQMQKLPLFQYSQTYIEHGYLELSISSKNGHMMIPNHLHIWPRGEFMMIALPNKDGSWTVTLFMALTRFKMLTGREELLKFFESTFPDAIELIGEEDLVEQFFSSPPSHLISIKCYPYHFENRALIIGDAAHAMVPFYGQGMNCGFQDCTLLDQLISQFDGNFDYVLQEFSERRKDDAFAICDLAMYNYKEMRDLVTKPSFRLRKALDNVLYSLFPKYWIPLYNSVSFSEIRYTECLKNREMQNWMITLSLIFLMLMGLSIIVISSWK
ncbi:kynurenine 3-monooxygenase [Harmonia axyridis]|uniref:kynurenine 3-monooxygenase n=1 Tax=Harmonia axyridis TaxID=115357 RepID=UPI001E279AAC|nr:kynurenine 3-monooxygenase [Harmonia axyridis]XP_045467972.1 kynurenine 3-monooxygenase [Harmonia axyridis]